MTPFPFASFIVAAVFALAAGLTLGGALIAVTTRRLIRAVAGLMISCVGLAGLYVFLGSPFLALMEILIYVGAVCVTIVFAVMLAEPDEPAPANKPRAWLWGSLTAIVSGLAGLALARLSVQGPWPTPPAETLTDGSVAAIGTSLLTTYSFVFELISLVLLVAILGALVIARSGRTSSNTRPTMPAPVGPALAAGRGGPPKSGSPVSPANSVTETIEA